MTETAVLRSSAWHLEEAAIHQQLADRATRRGYYGAADKHTLKAAWHREQAELLDPKAAA